VSAEGNAPAGAPNAGVQTESAFSYGGDNKAGGSSADSGSAEIVVTGSRLGGRRPASSTLEVIDRRRIDALGASSVSQVLAYIPQRSFGTQEGGNFGASTNVQLRGLGIGTTLILVNGRRTVTSALTGARNYFDLNTIPISAVDRIEVLSDSASAIYGADAVGGVVNIILKRDQPGVTADLSFGSADGGGEERRASVTFGHKGEHFRALAIFDAFGRDSLLFGDGSRFANQDFRRFGGTDQRRLTANPGNISSLTAANLPGLPSRIAAVPNINTGTRLQPSDYLATAGQTNLESPQRFSTIVPDSERYSFVGNAEYDFSDHVTAFLETLWSHRTDEAFITPNSLVNRLVPASNAFNPFGVDVSVNYLITGLPTRSQLSRARTTRGVAGLKGEFGAWRWEVSALRIRETGSNRVTNVLDAARLTAALASTNPATALNVFQAGPGGSPAFLQSLLAEPVVNHYRSKALQGSGFVRGKLLDLPAGPLQVVLGGEYRKEGIHFEARPAIIISPNRKSYSVFGEAGIPIVSGRHNLALNAAARYDHYSDFGGTLNPQIKLSYDFNGAFSANLSYGTSYRAPALFELYSPVRTILNNINDPRRGNALSQFTNISGGNVDLQPEKSTSWAADAVLTPRGVPGLRLGATFWSIHQDSRVQALLTQLILANEDIFPDRVVRLAPSPADTAAGQPGALVSIDSRTINYGRLKTKGLDFHAGYSRALGGGRMSAELAATWVLKYSAADFPNTPSVDRVGIANLQGTIPEWSTTGSLSWVSGPWGVTGTGRFIDSYDDATQFNVANGRKVGSQFLFDLQGSLELGKLLARSPWAKGFTLRAGAINLFDKAPHFSEVGGPAGYDPSQADLRQRFLYVRLSKSF
jgi:iron complex outermembrane receptor protein